MTPSDRLPEFDNYTLGDEIGGGTASRLYAAEQLRPQRRCVLKIIDLAAFENPAIANALKREGDTVARLNHPNVVTVYECGVVERFYYLAMEYLDGGDLRTRIARGMGWRDSATVARAMADALAHAHARGVVHRDIKPGNVLFREDGQPVLCDFGIAKILAEDSELTRQGITAGTPHYMAPEQYDGAGATPQSDIYALGVLLFEMATGRRPFDGPSVEALQRARREHSVPEFGTGPVELQALIRKMLLPEPAERPAEASAVADKLEAILADAGGGTVARSSPAPDAATVIATGETTIETEADAAQAEPGVGVGSVLRERFRIEAVLGEGGMGTVYYALDLLKQEAGDEDPYVAMKVLHPGIANAEMTFMALQREARRAQDLAHPNIVTVYDIDRVGGIVYITMELLRGEDSGRRLRRHPDGFDPAAARTIVHEIGAGLAYAHERGITHADLKPQNVFLCDDGRAKLVDFGIARAHRAAKPDVIEEIFSGYTPAYASPEILAGEKAMPTDDVYALGCIAYYYFTGNHPFDKRPASEARDRGLRPQRHPNLRRAEWKTIAAALDFDAARRPSDAAEFIKRFAPSRVKQTAVAVSSLSIVTAVALGLLLGDRQGPEVPFEQLPEARQQRIESQLQDAGFFLDSGDVNAALQLYDDTLKLHPGNRRAVKGMRKAVGEVLNTLDRRLQDGRLSPTDARAVLDTLLNYETLPESARQRVSERRRRL